MDDDQKGIIYMIMSSVFFALMAVTVKFLGEFPLAEKIFFRNLVGIFFGLFLVIKNNKSVKTNNLKIVLIRNLAGFIAIATYFYAISQMKMADAVILNKTSPFFVIILASIFLNEKLKKVHLFSLLFAITGALFVIKPSFNSSIIPALIALSAGVLSGISYTLLRHLRKTESSETIVLSFCTFSTLASLPFLLTGNFVIPSLHEIIALFSLGIFAVLGQFFITQAYRFAEAGEVSIYAYTNIVFSAIFGIVLFNEMPDALSFFGGALIISAAFINYFGTKKVKKEEKEKLKRRKAKSA
ncbi:DMT family transporter [Halanaerobium praevalens]|uniref:EamA domain-containing protein n=1 Tax=Halanaerobium praevalens (strain ATCC 33744 / DSM 2228 / GSL) TaxID=572479 RepID=E3DNA2_HALPG|nr:DMT family transporter [Halanaerobium praevalens]ADO77521.1 protein of unknown function DUF6 transmembrane [Halanaerobium praevalens DSM 2228]